MPSASTSDDEDAAPGAEEESRVKPVYTMTTPRPSPAKPKQTPEAETDTVPDQPPPLPPPYRGGAPPATPDAAPAVPRRDSKPSLPDSEHNAPSVPRHAPKPVHLLSSNEMTKPVRVLQGADDVTGSSSTEVDAPHYDGAYLSGPTSPTVASPVVSPPLSPVSRSDAAPSAVEESHYEIPAALAKASPAPPTVRPLSTLPPHRLQ